MGTVETAHGAAWVEETGTTAPPLLLVHGSGLAGASWRRTLDAATSIVGRRTLVPDLLGYGRSEPAPRGSPVTADDDLTILERVTEVGGPFDVVAHSYGGVLAARLALRAPARIGRMVLVEPVLFAPLRRAGDPDPNVVRELAALYDEPTFLDDAFGGTEAWMNRFFDYWWGEGAWEKLPEPHRRASMRSAWKIYREVKSISASEERFEDFAALAPELTLVRGTKTTACAKAVIEHLARLLPRARVVELEGAGHMSPMTHPGELAKVIGERLG